MNDKITRFFNTTGLKIKKCSPTLLMIAGIGGAVGSTILACKATLKVKDILDERAKTLEEIDAILNDETIEYTEEISKNDIRILNIQTGTKILKLYSPALVLGVASIASIVGGQKILNKRNAALVAAYAVVDKSFKEYANRVRERFGEEVEKEIRYNLKEKEVEEIITDKNGKEKTVKSTIKVPENDLEGISPYARFFDDGNTGWTKDPEANLMILRRQQDYANEKLKSQGHLFLNEVYDMLGIPRSQAGQIVGWVYDSDNGDNYVDFGIYDSNKEGNRRFVNGLERTILLDFNVDGVIYDRI